MTLRARRSTALVFGESKNDTDSIKHLLEHLNPALVGRVSTRLRPASLTMGAGRVAVRSWLDAIAGPKAQLMRLTAKRYQYSEADSPAIAEQIKALPAQRLGQSASFDRLIATSGGIA